MFYPNPCANRIIIELQRSGSSFAFEATSGADDSWSGGLEALKSIAAIIILKYMLQGSCLVLNDFTETLLAAISCPGECFGGPRLSPSIITQQYLLLHAGILRKQRLPAFCPKPVCCGICGTIGWRRLRRHQSQDTRSFPDYFVDSVSDSSGRVNIAMQMCPAPRA